MVHGGRANKVLPMSVWYSRSKRTSWVETPALATSREQIKVDTTNPSNAYASYLFNCSVEIDRPWIVQYYKKKGTERSKSSTARKRSTRSAHPGKVSDEPAQADQNISRCASQRICPVGPSTLSKAARKRRLIHQPLGSVRKRCLRKKSIGTRDKSAFVPTIGS